MHKHSMVELFLLVFPFASGKNPSGLAYRQKGEVGKVKRHKGKASGELRISQRTWEDKTESQELK